MAEHENVEEIVEKKSMPAAKLAPAATSEKLGLLGQTPSMWFLIDSAVVLLIVVVMRFLS